MALVKNLKTPKVKRFKGSKSKFIMGLMNKDAIDNAKAV